MDESDRGIQSTVDWSSPEAATAPLAASPAPQPQVAARYQLVDELGRGGMAVVMVAIDRQLERRVALKLVRPDRLSAAERARLLREARVMAQLRHPNVVTIFDVDELDGQVAVAMELIDGGSLRRYLAVRAPSPSAIVEVLTGAGRGLAAAHAAGLVHRDFKPDNVLIDRHDVARVADFGLARPVGARGAEPSSATSSAAPTELEVTGLGVVVGTPAYMAPELLVGGDATPASDQFAFAVTLAEALSGTRPFAATTVEARRAERDRPPMLDGIGPGWLRAIVARGLAPDPSARFATMEQLLAALARDPARRRRRAIAGGAVVVAVVAAGVIGTRVAARAPGAAETCAAAALPMAGTWDPARREVLAAALGRSTAPYAPTVTRTVLDALDRYGAELVAAEQRACVLDTAGAQSREVANRRRACLARSRNQLGTVVDRLLGADDAMIARAGQAVGELQPIANCESLEALVRAEIVPADPERAARAAALQATVDRARIDVRIGRARIALPMLTAAVEQARALDHGPTLADALSALGAAEEALDQLAVAEAHQREAILVAQASGHDLIVGRTAAFLALDLGRLQDRLREAEPWSRLAVATAQRLGNPPSLESFAQFALSVTARELDQLDVSEQAGRRALAVAEAAGYDGPRRAELHNALGNTARRRGDFATAAREYRAGRALTAAAWGETHPALGSYDNNLAVIAISDGDPATAVGHMRTALANGQALRGGAGGGARIATMRTSLSFALDMAGDPVAARAEISAAVEAIRAAFGPVHPRTALTYVMAARIALGAGRLDDADAALVAATAALSQVAPSPGDGRALIEALDGIVALHRGQIALAQRRLAAALASAPPTQTDARGFAALGLAELARGQRQWSAAREQARAARAAFAISDGPRSPLAAQAMLEEGIATIASGDATAGATLIDQALVVVGDNPRFARVVAVAKAARAR